jgi:hypothetical protein
VQVAANVCGNGVTPVCCDGAQCTAISKSSPFLHTPGQNGYIICHSHL